MLVLTRSTGKSIVIGDDIVLTVLEVNGSQVRIGIDCPKDIPIHRQAFIVKKFTTGLN